MAEITLDRIRKQFANGFVAVDDVSLEIRDGEFMVLVGPSGCGKTSLLRLIAGLEEATAGSIVIGGRDVTELAPRKSQGAMVFQSYALYPHMSVRQNLGYGLKVRRTSKKELRRRVEEVARMLKLEELLDRRPAQLSGGQRQRVAMGRAVIREPQAFLMDEPLSNLDAKLALHVRLGTTTIYVTHDQVEAMTLGQRVAVMRDGRIQQVDTPQGLYKRPVNLFVAAFIGSPAMNLVDAVVDDSHVEFAGFRLPLPDGVELPAGKVILGLRPEAFEDAALADPTLPAIEVDVAVIEELGSDTHAIFAIDAPQVDSDELHAREQEEDELTLVGDSAVFNARVDPRSSARPGQSLRLAVDPARFHFFDGETGANLLREAPKAAQVA